MSPFPKDSLSRFVFGSAGTVGVLCLLWFGLSNPLTEAVDKVYFLSALGVGAVACLARFSSRFERALAAASVLGLAAMLWGLVTVEHQSLASKYWMGFGWKVTIATLLLLPAAGFLLRPSSAIHKHYRAGAYVALACAALVGALSFVQTRTSLSQAEHSGYVFNEIYAAAAGHSPYTDFVPQYQTLFSYLFYPLIVLAGAERAFNPVLLVLSALSVVTVALGVLAGSMATRGLNRVLAPLLILPLVFLTQGPGRTEWAGSISALHSAFPVRMLLPTLIGVVLGAMPVLGVQKWELRRHILPLGALLGLSCFHQLDFGLAAAVAVGTLVLLADAPSNLLRVSCYLGLALVAGFLAVPLLHWLADKPLDFGKVGWFIRQFGGGFGSEPIQIPGPVLVVLPLLVGSTATCIAALRAHRTALLEGGWAGVSLLSRLPQLLPVHRAALIGSYFGVFALCAFPYYLNRSYASGQLQILLLPLGIALCSSAQVIAACPEWLERSRSLKSGVLRFALAVPVASLLLLPSPAHEMARLSGSHAETRWPTEKTASIIALGEAWKRLGTYSSVGYWGDDGNYIEASTGLHNVTRFSSTLDGSMSPAAMKELCAGIADEGLQSLVLGERAPNPATCGGKWTFKRSKTGVVVAMRQRAGEAAAAKETAQNVVRE